MAETTRRKRAAFAIIVGTAAFGIIGASAATLGGINGSSLGADAAVVASCDTDGVTVDYTNVFNTTSGAYDTTVVDVTNINALCNGNDIALTLSGAGNAVLGDGSGVVAGGAASITLSTAADAESVTGISIVIDG